MEQIGTNDKKQTFSSKIKEGMSIEKFAAPILTAGFTALLFWFITITYNASKEADLIKKIEEGKYTSPTEQAIKEELVKMNEQLIRFNSSINYIQLEQTTAKEKYNSLEEKYNNLNIRLHSIEDILKKE